MEEKKKSKQQGKVILFPGTVERMFDEARDLAENYHYHEANELFEKALELSDGDEISLSVFAYSLYETKNFGRAKEICEDIFAIGPSMYFELMELYLTICMQLRQFKQVEKIIESLFDEDVIPTEQVEKFQRLLKLNAEIAENQNTHLLQVEIEEEQDVEFELNATEFLQLPVQQQLMQIHELTEKNIRPLVSELKQIIETTNIHPFIQSLLLILLVEQEVNVELTISKFNQVQTLNPASLDLPTKLPQFQEITNYVVEQLEQEPSTLEFVQYLIAKHAIVLYPFEWTEYNSEDVAISYIDFVRSMFGEIKEVDYEIVDFLQLLEKMSDLQE